MALKGGKPHIHKRQVQHSLYLLKGWQQWTTHVTRPRSLIFPFFHNNKSSGDRIYSTTPFEFHLVELCPVSIKTIHYYCQVLFIISDVKFLVVLIIYRAKPTQLLKCKIRMQSVLWCISFEIQKCHKSSSWVFFQFKPIKLYELIRSALCCSF